MGKPKMGYRKVGFLEQLLYIIEAMLARRWKWITGQNADGGKH